MICDLCPFVQFSINDYVLFHLQHRERTIPVLIIGILVFIPGFYHLRIAYYAYKGYSGYSYDDIPDFDDWVTWNNVLLVLTDFWKRDLLYLQT